MGDTSNKYYYQMFERLRNLGEVKKILDNTFVLNYQKDLNSKEIKPSEIRDALALPEYGYCMVVKIDKDFKSAWSLTPVDSDYFLKITGGKKDAKKE